MLTHNLGKSLVSWFSNNKIMLNTDKCHLLLNSQEPNTLKIGDLHINNTLSEKLLCITFKLYKLYILKVVPSS